MTLRQKTVLIISGALAALLISLYILLFLLTGQNASPLAAPLMLLAGLAVGGWLGWLLDRELIRPIIQLGRALRDIQRDGDLSQRVPVTGHDEIAALSRTANDLIAHWQAAMAGLQQREAERSRQLAVLAEASRAAIAHPGLEPLLARVVEVIHERFGCERVAVVLFDEAGAATAQEALGPALAPEVARTAATFPLRAGQRVIGALELRSERPNALSPADMETLPVLSDQIAVAVENDRLLGRQKRVLQLEDLTLALTNKIHQSLKPETILESAALELGRALGAQRAVVKLFGEAAPPVGGERARNSSSESLRDSPAQASLAPAPPAGGEGQPNGSDDGR